MSVITPKDLTGKSFSSSFKGYNKAEVDEYISKVTQHYSALYRRCAELEEQLAMANVRLSGIEKEERRAKQVLESAKEKSDCIIAEAYERADDILVAIKKNCDAILRDFREKVDAQKDALAEMNARVEYFKKDLFSKYRTHIELLEKISPVFDDEDYTSNEYVMRVVNELKHEITAEYDIAIGYDDEENADSYGSFMNDADLEEMPTEDEINAFINDLTKQAISEEELPILTPADTSPEIVAQKAEAIAEQIKEPLPEEIPAEPPVIRAEEAAEAEHEEKAPAKEIPSDKPTEISTGEMPEKAEEQEGFIPKEEVETTVIVPSNKRSSRKKKKQLTSVLEMLREYEESDARQIPKIEAQLMLNLDEVNDSLVESDSK
jgi:cell division initiation protein